MTGGSPRPQSPGISGTICTKQPFHSFPHRVTVPYFAAPDVGTPFLFFRRFCTKCSFFVERL